MRFTWPRFRFLRLGIGVVLGLALALAAVITEHVTSSDRFCASCHVHPHATTTWKESTHFRNRSGVVVHCTECHLPPGGLARVAAKFRLGVRDVWGKVTKDSADFDWEAKRRPAHAQQMIPDAACRRCHVDLFSVGLSKKGEEGHIHYLQKKGEVRCVNCHLGVGHARESKAAVPEVAVSETRGFFRPPMPTGDGIRFEDYVERIPGTQIHFEMVAIPGGEFEMGSPLDEPYRRPDEGPVHRVRVDSFWMGRVEVTWAEYDEFVRQTGVSSKHTAGDLDVETGPTPPYGNPDQGWGRGTRPAITMTFYAATRYCEWLSRVTGRRYRLPTEAEWEYACRGGTSGPYFFEGDPRRFSRRNWRNRLFGPDTSGIDRFVWYAENARGRTHPPYTKRPNPFGLFNMLGNVREFCLDWYAPDAYSTAGESLLVNPKGPTTGTEHVVRGGSFASDAADVRCAARDHTRHDAWLMTDPQSPKSRWWYSDCVDVGFRVVREYHSGKANVSKPLQSYGQRRSKP